MIKTISIPEVRRDGGTQPRGMLDMVVVQNYTDALVEEGASFPPVTIFYDGSTYWLADGFHRTAAYEQAGKEAIHAEIHQGSQRDAVLYSLGANNAHGLQRSNADKQRAIRRLLLDPEWTVWSDRRIGQVVRCSHKTVGAARRRLQQSGEIPTVDIRKTAAGRVIDTSQIGSNQKAKEDPPQPKLLIEELTGELPSQPEEKEERVAIVLIEDDRPVVDAMIRKELERYIDPDGRFTFTGPTSEFLQGVAEEFDIDYRIVSKVWMDLRFPVIKPTIALPQVNLLETDSIFIQLDEVDSPTLTEAEEPKPQINLLDTLLNRQELGEEKDAETIAVSDLNGDDITEEPKSKINLLDTLPAAYRGTADLRLTTTIKNRDAGASAACRIQLITEGGKLLFLKKTTAANLAAVLLTALKPYLPEEIE